MASNAYSSANITPSSDTFREWVDLTNRITYDMEKYVVTTAPFGNTQGAETIGNGYVNGFFGANTLKVFDELQGATGNTTDYGTGSPTANLIISTNTVFFANSTYGSEVHAQANVYFTNTGVQILANTTNTVFIANGNVSDFISDATRNRFNTQVDINANVDIDNGLTTIDSTNTYIASGELNIDSNTVFNANVHAHANRFEISSNNVIVTANANVLRSNATLNDFNSNVDIDNALTTIDSTNTYIASGELNVDSNTVFNANVYAHADTVEFSSNNVTLTANVDTFQSNAALNDFNSNVDIDNALTTIDSTNTSIGSGELNISSNLVVNSTATNANIAANVALSGANVYVTSTNVNITSTGVTIGDANSDLLTVNSNTVLTDKLNVQKNADFDSDVNVDGNVQVDQTVTVGNSSANAHISTEGNIDTDGTLTVDGASDLNNTLNVSGITTLENTQNSTSNTTGGTRISGGVGVVKSATIGEKLTVHGAIDGKSTLTVANNTDLNGELDVLRAASFSNTLTVTGFANLVSTLEVNSTSQFDDTITVGNSTANLVVSANGNVDTDGQLFVKGTTHLQDQANVDGLLRAKGGANVTGTANVSSTLHVSTGDGQVKISNDNITVGNSTVNSSITVSGIHTDGILDVDSTSNLLGAVVMANTLNTQGNADFDKDVQIDQTLTIGNSTANVVIANTGNIDTDGTLTVAGATLLNGTVGLGDATGDDISINGRVATNIVPNSNADQSIGTSALRWDVYGNHVRTVNLTATGNAQIDGFVNAVGSANVGYPFEVSNTTTVAFKVQTRNSGNDREIIVGNTVPNATHAEDRLVIRSAIGNSTIGVLPLHGNNVVLGDATHRWVFSANTGDFSGAVNISDTTESSSDTTGALKVAGGLGVDKKAFLGSDVVITGSANVGTNLDVTGTSQFDDAITIGNSSVNAVIAASGNIDTDGTLTVDGKTTLTSDAEIGGASSDTTLLVGSIGGNSTVGIIPSANGRILGTSEKRFAGQLTTLNASGDITAGSDVDISGEVNAASAAIVGNTSVGGNLDVTGTSQFDGAITIGNSSANAVIAASGNIDTDGTLTVAGASDLNSTLNVENNATFQANVSVDGTLQVDTQLDFGNSSVNANLTANTTKTAFAVDAINATDLVITGSAVLPDDTTLTATELGTANLNVTDTTQFLAATSNSSYKASVKFGNGNDRLVVNFANAVVNTHFISDTTARDLGTSSNKWGEVYLADKVNVGNSSIYANVFVNSTASYVIADNIIARDDLVAASSSDQRLKSNVLIIDTAIDKVESIGGYEFEWNSAIGDFREGTKDYGVLAQEVEQILPHAVTINSRGYKTVNYNSLIPLLIEAVKELSGRVRELERVEEE